MSSAKRPRPDGPDSAEHASKRRRHESSSSSSKKQPKVLPAAGAAAFIPEVDGGTFQKKKQSEFLCDVEYRNTLPDPPFDPKLRLIRLPKERLTRYRPSVDLLYKMDLVPNSTDLDIPLSLLDSHLYMPPEGLEELGRQVALLPPAERDRVLYSRMHEKDKALFPESMLEGKKKTGPDLSIPVTWLRRPDYMVANPYDTKTSRPERDRQPKEEKKPSAGKNTRESQIEAIEETFRQAQLPLSRPKPGGKPGETEKPVKEWYILPHPLLDTSFIIVDLVAESGDSSGTLTRAESNAAAGPAGSLNAVQRSESLLTKTGQYEYVLYVESHEEGKEENKVPRPETKEAVVGKKTYKWVRELAPRHKPVPIDPLNNFFFIVDEAQSAEPGNPGIIHYARFQEKLTLKKLTPVWYDARAAGHRSREAAEIDRKAQEVFKQIESRPSSVTIFHTGDAAAAAASSSSSSSSSSAFASAGEEQQRGNEQMTAEDLFGEDE